MEDLESYTYRLIVLSSCEDAQGTTHAIISSLGREKVLILPPPRFP